MAFVRCAYLALTETHHAIEGRVMLHTMENMDGVLDKVEIDLSFYRPSSGLPEKEWLKDMLVQVIEQL